jgi:hypothetical protein
MSRKDMHRHGLQQGNEYLLRVNLSRRALA